MKLVIFLYPGMTTLDMVGPHEVLARLPDAEVIRVAETAGPVMADTGLQVVADAAISEVDSADILLMPGGTDTWPLLGNEAVLEWVRAIDAGSQWTTSVCTGSLVYAAAGLLAGHKATTHWATLDVLKEFGAEPVKSRVVESGKYMTAAGVSAGIDMGLTLAARIAGDEFAQLMQLAIEYDPEPPFDAGSPEKAPHLKDAVIAALSPSG